MEAFSFVLAILCLWLALHTFTTYPLSLVLLARIKSTRAPVTSDAVVSSDLRFAVLTCAYNEQSVIEAKLQNLLALKAHHPNLEILIYVDCASDATAAICGRYKEQIFLHVATQRHGKTHGMNLLAQHTKSDILVFTDANVMLAPDIIERFESHFHAPEVGCVCGNLNYVNAGDSITAQSGSLYWRVEEKIKRLETATGGVIGADGSLFAMRRSLHTPPPDHIIDDFYLSLMVMCQGRRVIQALDVKAYEETVAVSNEEFRRKIRIACQAFNVHRMMWPKIAQLDVLSIYKYVSHKLLRWLSIFFLVAAWAFAVLGATLAGWWVVAVMFASAPLFLWVVGARWPIQPFSQIYDILEAFFATGVGVLRSLRGDRFQTWAPAASLRK